MPPRGNSEGLDFTPILTHYLFLFTSILAIIGWFVAFIGQAIATAQIGHGSVGVLWFSIFLQLFLILGVLHTLATDSVAMNRFQISVFGAVAIVFAVIGVNQGIFSGNGALDAMAAGWLILAMVDIIWTLYFTSEEDSLILHIFNSMGTGGLSPPSRRRRTRPMSVHNMGAGNGYAAGYAAPPGGISSGGYDTKSFAGPVRSDNQSFKAVSVDNRSMGGAGSVSNAPANNTLSTNGGGMENAAAGLASPMMGPGAAGVGAGGGPNGQGSPGALPPPITAPADTSVASADGFTYRAKALYAYNASSEDPNEISFAKGEILDIIDKQGKWWQAKKSDGTVGIAPSNYLQII
ncbi:hypothetical protein EUX98_g786 [Antrodiella citrinella]|uniref:SH3 domain-containing protein n=1 Tax=Antrodiella citrinella TaxID=2447956 RepID=A0A4S4N331_9APHY|nr:hypothetical protein EUX98_g786 [Antrodiella citrinella]